MLRNFWLEPPNLARDVDGASDDDLDAFERRIGFMLPAGYRTLLRRQNGGAIRYPVVDGTDLDVTTLYGVPRAEAPPTRTITFREYLLTTMTPAELDDVIALVAARAPLHPERLILISGRHGHGIVGLDYGYREALPREAPRVVFVDDDGFDDGDDVLPFAEIAAFDDFEAFLKRLVPDGALEHFIGIETDGLDYDDVVAAIEAGFGVRFTVSDTDRYGHYDFARWHTGFVPTAPRSTKTATLIVSPNRHRSGRRLFNDEEATAIVEVHRIDDDAERFVDALCARLAILPGVRRAWRLT